jgi:hypothetical protein
VIAGIEGAVNYFNCLLRSVWDHCQAPQPSIIRQADFSDDDRNPTYALALIRLRRMHPAQTNSSPSCSTSIEGLRNALSNHSSDSGEAISIPQSAASSLSKGFANNGFPVAVAFLCRGRRTQGENIKARNPYRRQ